VPKALRGESGLWVALAVAAVIALPAAFFLLPSRLVSEDVGTKPQVAKARNDARATTIQLVGAMVVAVGLVLTARTYLLARQGQLTERFSKAAEQLGSTAEAVRLGGIFALGQLAHDADAELQHEVRAILAAFVRQRAPWNAARPRPATDPPASDVQAALTVLGRVRPLKDKTRRRIDLSRADLRSADMRGARLDGVVLGESHLEWATMTGAQLEGAVLTEAHMDHADLSDATLTGAKLHAARLHAAKLCRAELEGAELDGADLTHGADLTGARNANLLPATTDASTIGP
jgi:hypothetical protein